MRQPESKKHQRFSVFRKSLLLKFLVPIVLLLILTGGIVAFVSYQSNVRLTTGELTENVEGQMKTMNDTFDICFSNIESILDRFVSHDLLNELENNKDEMMQMFQEAEEATKYIYTGLASGEMYSYPDDNLGLDYVIERFKI